MLKHFRFLLVSLLVTGLGFMSIMGIATAQSVVQSYSSSSSIGSGLIVQLANHSKDKVTLLTRANINQMFGVVVNPNQATESLSSSNNSGNTFVATTGNYPVLVSDENGSISEGDYVTISLLDGIGMKATSADPVVLGKALGSFVGSSQSISTATLKNGSSSTTVHIGTIMVSIGVAHNPLEQSSKPDLPGFLLSAGQSIANKPVTEARVYVSLIILVISALIAGSMLYAGVRSSVISIGRNPLSKHSVFKGLLQVTLTSLTVFIIGLFAVYLLLKV